MCKKILLYTIVFLLILVGWKIVDERSDIYACRELRNGLEPNAAHFNLELYQLVFEMIKFDSPDGDNKHQSPEAKVETACYKDANDITNDLNIIGKQFIIFEQKVNIIGQKIVVKKSLSEIDIFLKNMEKRLHVFWISSDRKNLYKRYCSLFSDYRSFFIGGMKCLDSLNKEMEELLLKLDNLIELLDEMEKGAIKKQDRRSFIQLT